MRRPGNACSRGPAPTRIPPRAPHAPPTRLSRPRRPGVPTGRRYGVSVVGYADDTLSRLSCFNLTTVGQGAQEQARHAVTAAVERLDQDRTEPRDPHLVLRGTTAEPGLLAALTWMLNSASARSVFPYVGPAATPFDEPGSGDIHLVPVLQAGFLKVCGDVEQTVGDADEVVTYADAPASVLGGRVYDDGLIGRHRASVPSGRVGRAVWCASCVMLLGADARLQADGWERFSALRPGEVVVAQRPEPAVVAIPEEVHTDQQERDLFWVIDDLWPALGRYVPTVSFLPRTS